MRAGLELTIHKSVGCFWKYGIIVLGLVCSEMQASIAFNEWIVNGEEAEEGVYPYTVAILVEGQVNGTGVAIGPTWVLTAAHVVHGDHARVEIIADETDTNNAQNPPIVPRRIIEHDLYDHDLFQDYMAGNDVIPENDLDDWYNLLHGYDLALIELNQADRLADFIPYAGATEARPEVGEELRFMGYGDTENGYTTILHEGRNNVNRILPHLIELVREDDHGQQESGDSGGPAVAHFGYRDILVGINVATDVRNGRRVDLMVRLTTHTEWIQEHTGILPHIREIDEPNNDDGPQTVPNINVPRAIATAGIILAVGGIAVVNNGNAIRDNEIRMNQPENEPLVQNQDLQNNLREGMRQRPARAQDVVVDDCHVDIFN